MRIVENSPHCLRLADRTLWITWVCCGAAFLMTSVFYIGQGEQRILLPAAIFALFGLAFLRSSDVVFDKDARVCRISRRDILRVRRRQFGFGEIADVRLESGPASGTSQVPTFRLSLAANGETVPLTAAFEGGEKRYQAMRDAVVQALWAEKPEPGAADPVAALVKDGHLAEAVRILRERDGLDLATATARVADLRVQYES